ncbi:MAG: AMP-binding protein [Candidatus Edwardsbacteria bacterium]|nr:AMP-binding protein [Candidatus Edwardsbacteria bacterium]
MPKRLVHTDKHYLSRQGLGHITIKGMLARSAGLYPFKTALQIKRGDEFDKVTYRELKERADQLESGLVARGIKFGDRVAVIGENCPEWAESYFALASLGAVIVPLDSQLKAQEIRHILTDSESCAVIATDGYQEMVGEAVHKLPTVRNVYRMNDLSALYEPPQPKLLKRQVQLDDLAVIIYTSGTTGQAKGVMLSNKNIMADVDSCYQTWFYDHHDTFISVLPLHHTFEATGGMLVPLYAGATICYARSLKSRDIVNDIRDSQATMMLGVPLLFEKIYEGILRAVKEKPMLTRAAFAASSGLVKSIKSLTGATAGKKVFGSMREKAGLSTLRLLVSGGAALKPEVAVGLETLGLEIMQGYGLTESAPVLTLNNVARPDPGSVGPPIADVEIKIVEPDATGIGEIAARGPNIMLGYYQNQAATDAVIRDGWLHTGDLGYIDQRGCVFITGRAKNVIISAAGKNIYPEEVEAQLAKSPYVAESLVIGEKHEQTGREEVHAIVYPNYEKLDEYAAHHRVKLDEAQIERIIKAEVRHQCAHLAEYKRVKHFSLREEEFPKTTTRKIKRYLFVGKKVSV